MLLSFNELTIKPLRRGREIKMQIGSKIKKTKNVPYFSALTGEKVWKNRVHFSILQKSSLFFCTDGRKTLEL